MSLFFADLVREASHGVGGGDMALEGALPGHRRFADAVPAGARFHYCIAGVTHPGEWETGEGEIGAADVLVRSPLASSAAGAAVDFSPGLKTVALTVGAAWFARKEEGVADIEDVAGLQAALDGKAGADPTLSALAALDAGPGLIEQTGPDSFGKRAIGTAAATDILTRGDGDGRYALGGHAHAAADIADLGEAVEDRVAALLAAGDKIALAHDDEAGSLTVSVTGLAAVATSGSASDLGGGSLAVARGGTGATSTTGSGANVLSGSPAFSGTISLAAAAASGDISARSLFATGLSAAGSGAGVVVQAAGGIGFVQGYNYGASAFIPLIVGGSTTTIRAAALDVVSVTGGGADILGQLRCDSLRIDASPSPSAAGATHKLPVNLNGATYYLLLSSA